MIKLDKLAYVADVEVEYRRIEQSNMVVRRGKPAVPAERLLSPEERKEKIETFLSLFKRAAKLSLRRGHYQSHSKALNGLARRLEVRDYSALQDLLDGAHPDSYPWAKVRDIKNELLEDHPLG